MRNLKNLTPQGVVNHFKDSISESFKDKVSDVDVHHHAKHFYVSFDYRSIRFGCRFKSEDAERVTNAIKVLAGRFSDLIRD